MLCILIILAGDLLIMHVEVWRGHEIGRWLWGRHFGGGDICLDPQRIYVVPAVIGKWRRQKAMRLVLSLESFPGWLEQRGWRIMADRARNEFGPHHWGTWIPNKESGIWGLRCHWRSWLRSDKSKWCFQKVGVEVLCRWIQARKTHQGCYLLQVWGLRLGWC